MQTLQPLSLEEKQVIKTIYKAKASRRNPLIVLGCFLIFIGLFFYLVKTSDSPKMNYNNNIWIAILLPPALGIGLLTAVTFAKRKYKQLLKAAMLIKTKEVITGYLKEVTIISNNQLRYNFGDFSTDVSLIMIPILERTIIHPIRTSSFNGATLHTVKLPTGENMLLKVFYDNSTLAEETTLPLTVGDKISAIPFVLIEYSRMFILLLFIGIVLTFWARLEHGVWPIVTGILLFICLRRIMQLILSSHKVMITTTITEHLRIIEESGKYSAERSWYRLANGLLINRMQSDTKIGDLVRVCYLHKKDGTRGRLVKVENITLKKDL